MGLLENGGYPEITTSYFIKLVAKCEQNVILGCFTAPKILRVPSRGIYCVVPDKHSDTKSRVNHVTRSAFHLRDRLRL